MGYKWALLASFLLAGVLSATRAARADAPLSIYAAAQFQANGSTSSDTVAAEPDVGISYDLGPRSEVPVRARVDLDDYVGTGANASFNDFSFGASARMTTPTYFGIGTSLDFVNLNSQSSAIAYPAGIGIPIGRYPSPSPPTSTAGIGLHFFAGQKLVSSPSGFGLALEATYKFIPHVQTIDPSGFGIGLRASL